jgi:hypothetical protein
MSEERSEEQPQTTTGTFNGVLRDFVVELAQTFPECASLESYSKKLESICSKYPEKPMKRFISALSPYGEMIVSKDAALFTQDVELFGGFNLNSLAGDDVSETTRDAVWQYLSTLFVLGTTISSFPPEIMRGIEGVAIDLAKKIESGEMKMEDVFAQMTKAMMTGGGGFPDLGKLLQQ